MPLSEGLDARDILKFPLLAASSKMETTPMADKADNAAMRPHPPEKTGTCHTDHQWKVEGGKGGEKPLNIQHKMLFLPATLVKMLYSHEESNTSVTSMTEKLTTVGHDHS